MPTGRSPRCRWLSGESAGSQSLSAGFAREKWVAATPEATMSPMASHDAASMTSPQNSMPNRLEKITVL